MSRSYLGSHPQLSRKVNATEPVLQKTLESVDVQAITQQFVLEEQARIQDLQLLIKAYQVKIKEELQINIDHSESIAHLDNEVKRSRAEQEQILEQIENCRKVEKQVTPMEYYLWKKKQRINTFDASIAELCREIEENRMYLKRSIEEHQQVNESLLAEIEELQDKIANFNISVLQSGSPASLEEQDLEELIAQNNKMREEEETLQNDIAILQENRAILEMQVIDNIDSIVSSIKSYYEEEKTSIVRDFKQIQAEVRLAEVSGVTREDQAYNIDPLLNDYSYKMSEMLATAPESVRKHIPSVVQPLPWKSFNWSEFLGFSPNSNSIYEEHTRLQKQIMTHNKEIQSTQLQLMNIKIDLASQQQKSNEIAMNIYKVKQKLR